MVNRRDAAEESVSHPMTIYFEWAVGIAAVDPTRPVVLEKSGPSLSDHRRSPVMTGRLKTACAHWSSPAGEKLTVPVKYERRVIRVRGSAHAMPALNVRASASASPIANGGKFFRALRVIMGSRVRKPDPLCTMALLFCNSYTRLAFTGSLARKKTPKLSCFSKVRTTQSRTSHPELRMTVTNRKRWQPLREPRIHISQDGEKMYSDRWLGRLRLRGGGEYWTGV